MSHKLFYSYIFNFCCIYCCNAKLFNGGPYSGNQVLRSYPLTDNHLQYLSRLEANIFLDFWTKPQFKTVPVDIMTSSNFSMARLQEGLADHGIRFEVWISNVQEMIYNSTIERVKQNHANDDDFSWNNYHTYKEINKWLKEMEKEYPSRVTVSHIGFSYEGRSMKILKLSKFSYKKKPAIWIDGGTHGREWISPAVVTYIINQLLENDDYKHLTSEIDFYFLPIANPDGYAYTFTEGGDRLWSKTRSRNRSIFNCRGVNMDANWNFHWQGMLSFGCNQNFPGVEAFSEVETRNIRSQLMSVRQNLRAYLTLHSYSQLWLYPWGYTSEWTRNYEDIDNLAYLATTASTSYRQTQYRQHSMCTNEQYCTTGSSIDWVKGLAFIKYSYHIKLPDQGTYGFLLPSSEIIPTGEELLRAVVVVGEQVLTEFDENID